jgi:tetratricopeptide (TPR) repeat protein
MKNSLLITVVILLLVLLSFVIPWDFAGQTSTIPITTRSKEARQDFLKGRDLAERLREREACDYFEKAVAEDPQFAYACLWLARLHPNAKTRLNFLIRAEELSGSVSEGERLLILGSTAYTNREPQEERKLMERLVEAYPDDPRAHNEYGNSLYWQKDWPAAIKEYLIAVKIDPLFSQPYNGLGYCYRFVGNLNTAEDYFLKYIELLPDDPNPYDSYADVLSEMGRHQEAITIYRKAAGIRPDFISSNLGIAWNYCVLGEYSKAIDQLNMLYKAASDDNRRGRALFGMAVTYVDEGNFEQALSALLSACEIDRTTGDQSSLSEDLDRLGLIYLEAGRPDDASRAFSASLQAMQDVPGTPKTVIENAQLDHMRRTALVWLTRGDLKTSLDLARRYLEITKVGPDPRRVQQAHQTLGLVELASGNLRRAIDELNLSDVSEAYTQYHLARAHEAAGNVGQALKYYRLASTYDQFNSLTQAFVRKRAKARVESLLLARNDTASGTAGSGFLSVH